MYTPLFFIVLKYNLNLTQIKTLEEILCRWLRCSNLEFQQLMGTNNGCAGREFGIGVGLAEEGPSSSRSPSQMLSGSSSPNNNSSSKSFIIGLVWWSILLLFLRPEHIHFFSVLRLGQPAYGTLLESLQKRKGSTWRSWWRIMPSNEVTATRTQSIRPAAEQLDRSTKMSNVLRFVAEKAFQKVCDV